MPSASLDSVVILQSGLSNSLLLGLGATGFGPHSGDLSALRIRSLEAPTLLFVDCWGGSFGQLKSTSDALPSY